MFPGARQETHWGGELGEDGRDCGRLGGAGAFSQGDSSEVTAVIKVCWRVFRAFDILRDRADAWVKFPNFTKALSG